MCNINTKVPNTKIAKKRYFENDIQTIAYCMNN